MRFIDGYTTRQRLSRKLTESAWRADEEPKNEEHDGCNVGSENDVKFQSPALCRMRVEQVLN